MPPNFPSSTRNQTEGLFAPSMPTSSAPRAPALPSSDNTQVMAETASQPKKKKRNGRMYSPLDYMATVNPQEDLTSGASLNPSSVNIAGQGNNASQTRGLTRNPHHRGAGRPGPMPSNDNTTSDSAQRALDAIGDALKQMTLDKTSSTASHNTSKETSMKSKKSNLKNMKSKNTSKSAPEQVESKEPLGPLTVFTKFAKLPPELRRAIWGFVCLSPRLLEVSWDLATGDRKHYFHRLAPKSCLPPAVMSVNQESRDEAKRYYQLVVFTSQDKDDDSDDDYRGSKPIETWYNPTADVLLFADNTCMYTIVKFFQCMRVRNVQISRVAILVSGKVINCHDWNRDNFMFGPDQMEIDYGYAIGGGCTVMQALHGIHRSVALTRLASGVKNLKEVFFVVPTFLTPITPGTVDDSIWFRPACSDGITTGQVTIKRKLEADVNIVRSGMPLPRCGPLDNWTRAERPVEDDSDDNKQADDKEISEAILIDDQFEHPADDDSASVHTFSNNPILTNPAVEYHNEDPNDNSPPNFHFVSFTPLANQGDNFDAISVLNSDIPKFHVRNWAFMKKIEKEARVHIKVPDLDFPTQVVREIGFYGKPEGVAKAKKMVQDRLAIGQEFTQKIGRRGYRSNGKVEFFGSDQGRNKAAEKY